jgi:hypothetical protein
MDGLLRVMAFESGINPAAINKSSNAAGLIQFMPFTSKQLIVDGKSLAQAALEKVYGDKSTKVKSTDSDIAKGISLMSRKEQLPYVREYYKPHAKHLPKIKGAFPKSTFYPYLLNVSNPDYVIGSEIDTKYATAIAKQNPVFDVDKDDKVTLSEYERYIESRGLIPDGDWVKISQNGLPKEITQGNTTNTQERKNLLPLPNFFATPKHEIAAVNNDISYDSGLKLESISQGVKTKLKTPKSIYSTGLSNIL